MAGRHQVTCTKKDGADEDRRIDGIGGATGAEGTGGPWNLPIDTAINGLRGGKWTFFVNVNQRQVEVIVGQHATSKRYYLTTEGDGFPPNNLLNLPDCR